MTSGHLSSPRVITDQTGQVTNRKDYMAFGEETQTAQRTASLKYENQTETRKGYTGYEKDTESGLDFAQARYYNSSHGRYTSVDPLTASANLKNPQTFNRYSYVLNSPYKYTDPLGLVSTGTGACGDGCANDRGARGERGYNQDLADFLSRNMVRASFGHQATYESETNSVIANTSDAGSGNSHGNGGHSSQVADPPLLPFADDPSYNCLAWALGIDYLWIDNNWIKEDGKLIHKPGIRVVTKHGTKDAKQLIMGDEKKLYSMADVITSEFFGGKETTETEKTPSGMRRIVLFEDSDDPDNTHVLRQESDGTWSSKNGKNDKTTKIKNPQEFYNSRFNGNNEKRPNLKITYYFVPLEVKPN